MKLNFFILITLSFAFNACEIFEFNNRKAIQICQNQRIQIENDNALSKLGYALMGLSDGTWLDFANMEAQNYPNEKYNWSAKKSEEKNIYLVSFTNEMNWGHYWEVDINQQIVKHINSNIYLSRKYGHSRLDDEFSFEITNIKLDTLVLEKERGYYSGNSRKIKYMFKATVINKTGKTLNNADISGKLQIVFKEKTIEGKSLWSSGFQTKVSKSRPWKVDEERDFIIKTEGIDPIYLDYSPEYVFFIINLKAEDPIGYKFDRSINEYNLESEWENLKKND